MSICGLFLVDEDLFLNFLSSSYSLVTKSGTKLLKRGAKDASEYGIYQFLHKISLKIQHFPETLDTFNTS